MAKHRCAVIVPTKNAMPSISRVLEKVLNQNTPWSYDVIVIDSGSGDGTREYLRQQPRVRLIEIEPKNFGHGRTRNLAIEAADTEFVALLTHDAEPIDDKWLLTLVSTAEQDERIAGVFGRHLAYPLSSPFIKNDIDRHFDSFLKYPLVVDRHTDSARYATDESWRQALHFYSDNNSLMRKSVWEKFPYPDVEFAEDQLWARSIIEAGYAKAYAPDAIVYHSHDYTASQQFMRAFDESRHFNKYFGYKLSSQPLKALRSMCRLALYAFKQEMDEQKYGKITTLMRLRRARQSALLVAGHFLGSHHEKLPRYLVQRLSLDGALFRG
ncbi:rhamnosyltransferase [Neorhizobium sp. 2083]|uniref:glycosyltransferase family 2 protein n=1 Tax=Neorhizobium sp. 2083 TaxID=2817762 RepID=UPI00285CC2DA|nr:glycosyltransferase [Neorhizobium sp. 2083]MDR6816447.1 rhamnosyltransferase [Neorhizobium sp. 2083]